MDYSNSTLLKNISGVNGAHLQEIAASVSLPSPAPHFRACKDASELQEKHVFPCHFNSPPRLLKTSLC